MNSVSGNNTIHFFGATQGSTVITTDASGKVVSQNDTTPFGTQTGSSGFQNLALRYTGKDYDSDTGLYYFNARWYDPQTGRFTTEDPIKDGSLWYAYVGNNPMTFTDPTGLLIFSDYPAGTCTQYSGSRVLNAPKVIIKNGIRVDLNKKYSTLNESGCFTNAMSKIANAIMGPDSKVGMNDFGRKYTTDIYGNTYVVDSGKYSSYIDSTTGNFLDQKAFVEKNVKV